MQVSGDAADPVEDDHTAFVPLITVRAAFGINDANNSSAKTAPPRELSKGHNQGAKSPNDPREDVRLQVVAMDRANVW